MNMFQCTFVDESILPLSFTKAPEVYPAKKWNMLYIQVKREKNLSRFVIDGCVCKKIFRRRSSWKWTTDIYEVLHLWVTIHHVGTNSATQVCTYVCAGVKGGDGVDLTPRGEMGRQKTGLMEIR
jgi:hypothetical protein